MVREASRAERSVTKVGGLISQASAKRQPDHRFAFFRRELDRGDSRRDLPGRGSDRTVRTMRSVRTAVQAVAIWLSATLAIFTLFVVLTLARGGHFHRTPTCGPDVNIYGTVITAAGFGLIAWLAYWTLGARQLRWRWARLAGVTAIGLLIVAATVLGLVGFSYACTGL